MRDDPSMRTTLDIDLDVLETYRMFAQDAGWVSRIEIGRAHV